MLSDNRSDILLCFNQSPECPNLRGNWVAESKGGFMSVEFEGWCT